MKSFRTRLQLPEKLISEAKANAVKDREEGEPQEERIETALQKREESRKQPDRSNRGPQE